MDGKRLPEMRNMVRFVATYNPGTRKEGSARRLAVQAIASRSDRPPCFFGGPTALFDR
jgi:hypothetical protein